MLLTRLPLTLRCVRLACVKPAASVRSEPGSNSHVEEIEIPTSHCLGLAISQTWFSLTAEHLSTSPKTHPSSSTSHDGQMNADGSRKNMTVSCLFPAPNKAFALPKTRKSKAAHVSLSSDKLVKQQTTSRRSHRSASAPPTQHPGNAPPHSDPAVQRPNTHRSKNTAAPAANSLAAPPSMNAL